MKVFNEKGDTYGFIGINYKETVMAISCDCSEWDIMSVGDPHEVTCRTLNTCYACGTVINPGDKMYRQSFYDFDQCLTVAPAWLCEECGDMALNLID